MEIETIKKTQTEGVLEVKNISCGLNDYAVKFQLTLLKANPSAIMHYVGDKLRYKAF